MVTWPLLVICIGITPTSKCNDKGRLRQVMSRQIPISVLPSTAPHPIQSHWQFACHGYFGDVFIASHRDVSTLRSSFFVTASHALCRLPQQEAQQRILSLSKNSISARRGEVKQLRKAHDSGFAGP